MCGQRLYDDNDCPKFSVEVSSIVALLRLMLKDSPRFWEALVLAHDVALKREDLRGFGVFPAWTPAGVQGATAARSNPDAELNLHCVIFMDG